LSGGDLRRLPNRNDRLRHLRALHQPADRLEQLGSRSAACVTRGLAIRERKRTPFVRFRRRASTSTPSKERSRSGRLPLPAPCAHTRKPGPAMPSARS